MFMVISSWILLRMRNVSDKICGENRNKFRFQKLFFISRKSCCLWDNVGKCGRSGQVTDDSVTRRMRIACCIPKATDTHSEYVILTAFPLQQWLHGGAWVLPLRTLSVSIFRPPYVTHTDVQFTNYIRSFSFLLFWNPVLTHIHHTAQFLRS
jgi:hypothetical protein